MRDVLIFNLYMHVLTCALVLRSDSMLTLLTLREWYIRGRMRHLTAVSKRISV